MRSQTIQQVLVKSLEKLHLLEAAKKTHDEKLALHIFEAVCRFMKEQDINVFALKDIDLDAYDEDGCGYTLGAQIADVFLERIARQLGIEAGDFGAEDFYEVGDNTPWG